MADSVRIDKYVWAIRLYKTRSDATEACNGNKVQLNGAPAKPSKAVKIGDTISVRKGVALYTFKVLQIAEQRMGAQKVPEFAENLTPQSELDKLRAPHETARWMPSGTALISPPTRSRMIPRTRKRTSELLFRQIGADRTDAGAGP